MPVDFAADASFTPGLIYSKSYTASGPALGRVHILLLTPTVPLRIHLHVHRVALGHPTAHGWSCTLNGSQSM